MKEVYSGKTRFWELDFLRGIAIVSMILLHVIWAMDFFEFYDINFYEGFVFMASRTTAAIFILLVGICLTISYSRTKNREIVFKKYVLRGVKLIALGMFITFVSLFLPKGGTVVFGILHLIGFSIILAIPFLIYQKKWLNLGLGIFLVFLGIIALNVTAATRWFVWMGFTFPGFYTLDYFPLLPWFGVILIGIFLGNTFYPEAMRKFKLKSAPTGSELFCLLGRHSLKIYFLHMIIILAIVLLIKYYL